MPNNDIKRPFGDDITNRVVARLSKDRQKHDYLKEQMTRVLNDTKVAEDKLKQEFIHHYMLALLAEEALLWSTLNDTTSINHIDLLYSKIGQLFNAKFTTGQSANILDLKENRVPLMPVSVRGFDVNAFNDCQYELFINYLNLPDVKTIKLNILNLMEFYGENQYINLLLNLSQDVSNSSTLTDTQTQNNASKDVRILMKISSGLEDRHPSNNAYTLDVLNQVLLPCLVDSSISITVIEDKFNSVVANQVATEIIAQEFNKPIKRSSNLIKSYFTARGIKPENVLTYFSEKNATLADVAKVYDVNHIIEDQELQSCLKFVCFDNFHLRSFYFLDNTKLELLNQLHSNFPNILVRGLYFETLYTKLQSMQKTQLAENQIKQACLNSSLFRLFPLLNEDLLTEDNITEINRQSLQFDAYAQFSRDLGPEVNANDKQKTGLLSAFFNHPYYTFLNGNILDKIENEVSRLKDDKSNKRPSMQRYSDEIKKLILDNLQDAHTVKTVDTLNLKLHNALKEKLTLIVQDKTLMQSNKPTRDFFLGLLGVLLAMPLAFLPLLSKDYRHTFFPSSEEVKAIREVQRALNNYNLPASTPP